MHPFRAEFTTKGNRERTDWVDVSLDERIGAVEKLSKPAVAALHLAPFAVYRHSSGILHGTLFSAMYFFGATFPPGFDRSPDQIQEHIAHQRLMVLACANLAISAAIHAFDAAYGFDAARRQAVDLLDELQRIPVIGVPPDAESTNNGKG